MPEDDSALIIVRRVLAVLLAALLAIAFGACITVDRIAGAAFESGYLKDQLSDIEIYTFTDEVLIPLAVEEWLEEQGDWVPDNFGGVEFPIDATTQQVVAGLVREIFPPEYTRAVAEHVIDELVPYLAGKTDGFELRFDLGERVDFALSRAGGERSPVEAAFRRLDFGRVMIDGAYQTFETQAVAVAVAAGIDANVARDELRRRSPDRAAAAAWFTDRLFDSVDALVPYLLGEEEGFEIAFDFAGQPELAAILASLLGQTPDELASRGFVYTDTDLKQAVRGEELTIEQELDRRLKFLRRDFVYTSDDLLEDLESDGDVSGLLAFRSRAGTLRGALRWGSVIFVGGLLLSVGTLGGRRWPSRLIWAAGALFVVSSLWFVVAGPVYDRFGAPEIHDALLEGTEDWSGIVAGARLSFIERVETLVDNFAGGFAAVALRVALVSALATIAGAGWWHHSRRDAAGPDDAEAQPSFE